MEPNAPHRVAELNRRLEALEEQMQPSYAQITVSVRVDDANFDGVLETTLRRSADLDSIAETVRELGEIAEGRIHQPEAVR